MEETQLPELVLEAIDICANPADNFEHFVDDTYCSGSQTGPACKSNIGTVTPGAYLCPSADPMLEYVNTYALDEWTSKGNHAVCWGNDDYLDFDPFVSMSPEIKTKTWRIPHCDARELERRDAGERCVRKLGQVENGLGTGN